MNVFLVLEFNVVTFPPKVQNISRKDFKNTFIKKTVILIMEKKQQSMSVGSSCKKKIVWIETFWWKSDLKGFDSQTENMQVLWVCLNDAAAVSALWA